MACTGWRRSWLTAAKKRDFDRLSSAMASVARSARWRSTDSRAMRRACTMAV